MTAQQGRAAKPEWVKRGVEHLVVMEQQELATLPQTLQHPQQPSSFELLSVDPAEAQLNQ